MTNKVTIKLPIRMGDVERLMIEKTLLRNGGHLGHTSLELDISYSTLQRRLREWARKPKEKI